MAKHLQHFSYYNQFQIVYNYSQNKFQSMGTQDSKVIIGTPEEYKIEQQRKKHSKEDINRQKSFFKIQPCHYPHPLIQKHHSLDQNYHRCTMNHDGYPDSYNLCSKCEQYPQRIQRNRKPIYERNTYKIQKPQLQNYDYKSQRFKERQVLAPGQQVPAFYNGFSLPLDRYYKQKTQISDYIQPVKEPAYREDDKQMEESIYEERSYKQIIKRKQMQIDYEGFQQNLRL